MLLILQAVFQFALALLNHFPLFALTLRVKDPWRLPGKGLSNSDSFSSDTTYHIKGGVIVRPYQASLSARPSFVVTVSLESTYTFICLTLKHAEFAYRAVEDFKPILYVCVDIFNKY